MGYKTFRGAGERGDGYHKRARGGGA